jgi:hypothetical protein
VVIDWNCGVCVMIRPFYKINSLVSGFDIEPLSRTLSLQLVMYNDSDSEMESGWEKVSCLYTFSWGNKWSIGQKYS